MSLGQEFSQHSQTGQETEDVGLHSVTCDYGFGDAVSKDLAASGYNEAEIYACMNEAIEIPVQQVQFII